MLTRLPCDNCRERKTCDMYAEFAPRFVFSLFEESRPYCQGYDPEWFRGIEGCLQ